MSEKWSQLGANIWNESQPGPDTLAEVYLNSRGIRFTSWPAALRFHPPLTIRSSNKNFPP